MKKAPSEPKILAGDIGFKERPDATKLRLKALYKETGDPWIMKWEYE